MRELKHINISYCEELSNIEKNNIVINNIPNKTIYKDEEELMNLVKDKKIDLLIIEYDFLKLKKIRSINESLHIFAYFNELKREYLSECIHLKQVKLIDNLSCEDTIKSSLKECVKNIDSKKSNIKELKNYFYFDIYNCNLFYKNTLISLSKKELLFLDLLIKNENRALSYEEINKEVWNGLMSQDALRSVVKEIRKKTYKELIKNVSGVGYRLG